MLFDDTSLDPEFLVESSKNEIEDYICCICQLIPNPQTCIEEKNCGHLFCSSCLNSWLQKSNYCPLCKELVAKRNIKNKNKIVYRHLLNLNVICQQKNCDWKGTWRDYFEHSKKIHNIILDDDFELYKYYKATIHKHPLKFLDVTMDNRWGCDARYLPNKCFSGITDFGQTNGIKRFRCIQCDYDLCELCMKNYHDREYKIINDNSNNRGLYLLHLEYYSTVHEHPLVFLDKTNDNCWLCDGRKMENGCFSGTNDFTRTKGIPRFRCEKCNFDICENCFNAYKNKINYQLNHSYEVSCHEHPLVFLGKTKNNGWGCNGRFLVRGCFSGTNGFKQTRDIPRFRCERCDFDLCKNCVDYYHCKALYKN
eukprot:jgi/Orpsp1_1/1177670/evm.model.c7180000062374.2